MPKPLLFTPLKLRQLTLRNRIVVSPMCQYQAIDGIVQEWHLAHHARFALGGVGLAFVEATAVTRGGRITHGCTGLWSDDQIAGLRRIVDLYKSQVAAVGIQIGHSGRRGSSARPWEGAHPLANGGPDAAWATVGASPLPERDGYPVPRELSVAEIDSIVDAFHAAFHRARTAGFDTIEIHGAHGYLLHSFFSPVANQRTDAYGGSLENRMRLPLRIAEVAREVWPRELPVFYRASVTDGVAGGLSVDDTVALAKELKARGVDVIDCSSGGMSGPATLSTNKIRPGYQVPLAAAVKRGAGIATMAVGAILDGRQAEAILAEGHADLIAIGRELMVDPNWCLSAAQVLGLDYPFSVLPRAYSFYLERREKVLER